MQGEVQTGAAIDAYVSKKNPKLKPVTDAVRALVRKAVPKSREAINPWGIPTFEWTSLQDSSKLLEGTGKNLRHVKLREISNVHDANLKQLILEAKALNRAQPLGPAMRAKKTSAKR